MTDVGLGSEMLAVEIDLHKMDITLLYHLLSSSTYAMFGLFLKSQVLRISEFLM